MQKLITEREVERLPRLYSTEKEANPMAMVHLFSCVSGWDWYLTELEPEEGLAFGLVNGFESELGYISIPELEAINESKGWNVIERDAHFTPASVKQFQK